MTGTSQNDALTGANSATANLLSGGAGNDTITTADSFAGDTASGGDGADACTTDATDKKISCE